MAAVEDEILHDADSGDDDFDDVDGDVDYFPLVSDYSSDEEEDRQLQNLADDEMVHGDDVPAARQGRARGGGAGRARGRGARGRGARGRGVRGRGARGQGGGDADHHQNAVPGQRGRRRGQGRPVPPQRVWVEADNFQPDIPAFTAQPRVTVDTTGFQPIDFFMLYFEDLVQHFRIQTNKYAQDYIEGANLKPKSRVHAWTPTTDEEIKQFIGLLFLMGVIKKPDLNSYWSTDPLIRTPAFSAVMPRDRFMLLLKFWHMADNDDMPDVNDRNRDRLFKIRPVIDHLFEKFQEMLVPGRDVAIDESLLLWKGRLLFKQYIPLKRARFGIKIFMLCDSQGYTYRFRVYAGKDESTAAIDQLLAIEAPAATALGSTGKEVVHLMLPLLDKGYRLFIDNWYSSADLFQLLHERDTSCCGTLRRNRTPPCLRDVRVPKGQTASRAHQPLLAQKYHDKREVFMLTTCHTPAAEGAAPAAKPPCILEYNKKMGAVDTHDRILQAYDATRKTLKWYKKLAIRFLQIALLNAFFLSKKSGNPGTFLDFQKNVISSLIFGGQEPDVEDDHSVRLCGRHFIDVLPPTEGKARPQKRCCVCKKKLGVRKDTRYFCPDCPSHPGLCLQECFRAYHTKRFFWRD